MSVTPSNNQPIAFLFAYVRRMPKSIDELGQIQELRAQSAILVRYAKANGLPPPLKRPAITTYRSALFTRNVIFSRAAADARAASTALLVADLGHLLRIAKSVNPAKIMEDLDKLEVELIDCTSGKKWREFSAADRLSWMQEAASRKIGSAVAASKRGGQAPEIKSALKGALANRTKADQQANQLRPLVEELIATLGPDEPVTPAQLMRHFNEHGIRPARGATWSYNACKNLLGRLLQDKN
jgi:hypothetical protein